LPSILLRVMVPQQVRSSACAGAAAKADTVSNPAVSDASVTLRFIAFSFGAVT